MPKGPSHFALVKYWWRLQVHYTLRFSKHPYFSPVKIGAKVWIDQIIQLYMSSWLRLQTFSTEFWREINCIFKVNARKVYHKQFYIHPIFRNRQTFWNSKSFHPRSGLQQSLEFAVFYVITNQGLLQRSWYGNDFEFQNVCRFLKMGWI